MFVVGIAQGGKLSHQVLQIQRNLAVRPIAALVDAILGDVFAVPGVHAEIGDNSEAHILQQPQLHRAGSKHRADIAVTHILVEKRRPLLEQLRAAIVQTQRIFAIRAVGVDRFGIVPNGLQQGVIVDVFQKLVDLRFHVADLRTLAEQRGQRFFQLCYSAHGNSSNHFSDAAFSGQGGYAPQ